MEQTHQNAPLFPNDHPPAATHCDDCDEESFCNCENNERVTPYYADSNLCATENAPDNCSQKCGVEEFCRNATQAIGTKAKQLCRDLRVGTKSPYIKKTSVTRVELYRSPNDKTPIDRLKIERTKNVSACALAAIGACLVVTVHVAAAIVRASKKD